ncbi:tRNA (cytidine/uridine-2'-O-)-methyltransferase [Desulfitispora alkaliphila]|uniref:tRNA (uridine(34)/cytosine(34)/5- carboxymethylaminomethyluridine(34)-2'-O)- methyltransferase TrmL n=1 Tax=Desulfitispora alkaliphila TaxID=622674 RepID=UPI003D21E42D
MFNIVLVEPEIPQNTGNVVRTCAATGCNLHLVRPLGFSVEDKYLKRAGLDYWHMAKTEYYDSLEELVKKYPQSNFYYASTKAKNSYADQTYQRGDFFVFGKETAGLPEEVIEENRDNCIRLPMKADSRSLNLANSVAIVTYEALRQIGFPDLT